MAILCIDFDGTCITHEYPLVGKDIGAVPVLKKLVEAGHQLILFTMRSNLEGISPVTEKIENGGLQDAVNWFKDNDIPLFGINENPGQKDWTSSPKVYAHFYIDDAAIGCPVIYDTTISLRPFVDWKVLEEILNQIGLI